MEGDAAKFVPMLVDLEAPRFQSSLDDETAVALVRWALTRSTDYWADEALDWVEFNGVSAESVSDALRACIDDERKPQPLRHRALRSFKHIPR